MAKQNVVKQVFWSAKAGRAQSKEEHERSVRLIAQLLVRCVVNEEKVKRAA